MKSLSCPLALLVSALFVLPVSAQIIDAFGTNDSGNYNTAIAFNGGGSAATFAVNGSGQLQPTGGPSNTTIYLRNTGESLSDTLFGQSVSLDLVSIANPSTDTGSQLGADSIGFANTLTPTSGTASSYSPDAFELGILRVSNGYFIASSNTSVPQAVIPVNANFSLGSITETITRTGDTTFTYSFSGPGLIGGPLTGAFTSSIGAGKVLYFGPDVFEGNTPGDQIVDNFAALVPEPSTYALMLAGGLGLIVAVRRARARVTA